MVLKLNSLLGLGLGFIGCQLMKHILYTLEPISVIGEGVILPSVSSILLNQC